MKLALKEINGMKEITGKVENEHVTDLLDNFMQPAQSINLEKHVGLHGDEIAPGFRKIILNDNPGNGCMPDGSMNLVIDSKGQHQHWQKFCNEDGSIGYWQNVHGQVLQHVQNKKIEAAKIADKAQADKVALANKNRKEVTA
jgi:hypothetical protein